MAGGGRHASAPCAGVNGAARWHPLPRVEPTAGLTRSSCPNRHKFLEGHLVANPLGGRVILAAARAPPALSPPNCAASTASGGRPSPLRGRRAEPRRCRCSPTGTAHSRAGADMRPLPPPSGRPCPAFTTSLTCRWTGPVCRPARGSPLAGPKRPYPKHGTEQKGMLRKQAEAFQIVIANYQCRQSLIIRPPAAPDGSPAGVVLTSLSLSLRRLATWLTPKSVRRLPLIGHSWNRVARLGSDLPATGGQLRLLPVQGITLGDVDYPTDERQLYCPPSDS